MLRGPTNDGLGEYYRQMIEESDAEPVDVAQVLRDKKVDVLVSYLPVGSERADKAYAQAAMDAGCAFVNCLPVFIASDPEWAQKFRDAGVPIVGDDIKSQVAPRSRIACSPACSKIVACAWTARTSLMWAATWTS